MNKERLRAALEQYESCNLERHAVPTDGVDIDHIGYGINLEEVLPDEVLEYLGVEDEDDIQVVTQEQADWLFDYFIYEVAHKDAIKIYGDLFDHLSPLRQEILVNLSYNLGINKLKAFRKMNKAVLNEDWTEAARQMLDSKAAEQTGDRYNMLAGAFENDDEIWLELTTLYDQPTATEVSTTPELDTDTDTEDPNGLLKSVPTVTMLKELLRRTEGN